MQAHITALQDTEVLQELILKVCMAPTLEVVENAVLEAGNSSTEKS